MKPIVNNMESTDTNSTSNPKCYFDAEGKDSSQLHGDMQTSSFSASPSTSDFQNSSGNHNRKRLNSLPLLFKKDPLENTEITRFLPRHSSQSEISNNDSRDVDSLRINKQIHRDNSRNNLKLPVPATNENETQISTDPQSDTFSRTESDLSEPIALTIRKERIPTVNLNKCTNLLKTQHSISPSSIMTHEKDDGIDIKCQILSPQEPNTYIRVLPDHEYEEIDESDSPSTKKFAEIDLSKINTHENELIRQKSNETRTSINNEELENPVNQRSRGSQSRLTSPDNEESKVEIGVYNEENDEDEIWKNYTERPLLPLKPLQKQRSVSCTNLVQTIKGLSKRKTSANSRHSSPVNHLKSLLFPENELVQKKEICTAEANIVDVKTDLAASADVTIRMNDPEDYLTTKNIHESLLLNYAWFHPVDAKEASKRLLKMQQDGTFLIRPASNPTSEVLYTLCVVCTGRVYNFHIKNLKGGQITLGKRKKQREAFSSFLDMIKYHQSVPISIKLVENNQMAYVYLLITPSK